MLPPPMMVCHHVYNISRQAISACITRSLKLACCKLPNLAVVCAQHIVHQLNDTDADIRHELGVVLLQKDTVQCVLRGTRSCGMRNTCAVCHVT